MKPTRCPYCKSETFTNDCIRADALDTSNVESAVKFSKIHGYWYNECTDCKQWSLHKDGKQLKIKTKSNRPEKHSHGVADVGSR